MQYITHFLREVDPCALVSANLWTSAFMFLKKPEIVATLFYNNKLVDILRIPI